MNMVEKIEQLLKLAESTTFSGEREASLKKAKELSKKLKKTDTIHRSSKTSEINIEVARDVFVKAFYPWYLENVPEGYAPLFFYPYMQDVISRKCKDELANFPSNKKLARAYQDLNFLISDHCEDYIYYERVANIDYYGDYYIIVPEELLFWVSYTYDKDEVVKEAFNQFEDHKKKFFERLEAGEFDDNILNLNNHPLLEV